MSTDTWSVPLSDLVVDDELRQAANDAVESGWWSMGPRVARFEERFAELCGVPHAVAVGSGTAALHMALLATGCGPGSEVILPSLNFVAAANVVVHTGATPVFCDVRGAHDLTLDPDDVHAAVSERTRAIVVMHYGGVPCDMQTIAPLARERGIALIEDAAHAPGARVGRDACGSLGDVGCFSFFANKNLPVGEGGMVVTHDDEIAGRLRLLRSHGMTTLTWDRHRGHAHSYDVLRPGFNYRLDELRAAIGLVQLERLAAANEARRRAAARYRELLRDVDGIELPFEAPRPGSTSAHHLQVVLVPEGARDGVREALRRRGVQTSVHYPPIHRFSAYADVPRVRDLPRTELVADRVLTLPLFPHITDAQIDHVSDTLATAVADTAVSAAVRA